jgi:oligopeptide/dipeptide ABC transporter ATP-binding protein|tara:strand:- start:1046 stop:2020 length:975 start_codon:yes stop_codon:yes gene_type:complete
MTQAPALEVRDLHTHFFLRRGVVKAVDGVDFTLHQGEVLGIVGESGCGKSLTALSILRLIPSGAARTTKGEVLLNGEDLLKKSEGAMRDVRGRQISMILQDPQTSLNPLFTIGNQLNEAIIRQPGTSSKSIKNLAIEVLRKVKLAAPEQRISQYPHELSGGMKQRIVGAISISCAPDILIADEPTTALDVTIQLQYLKLLKDLQDSSGMGILFITHDFGVVAKMCDRVAVMYAGRVVETGEVREIFDRPAHPYTQALIDAVPKLSGTTERLRTIEGQPPSLSDLPAGCRFAARCSLADDQCRKEYPGITSLSGTHTASCWKADR